MAHGQGRRDDAQIGRETADMTGAASWTGHAVVRTERVRQHDEQALSSTGGDECRQAQMGCDG